MSLLPRTGTAQILKSRSLEGGELDAVVAIVSDAPATQVFRQFYALELILKQDILGRLANPSRSHA